LALPLSNDGDVLKIGPLVQCKLRTTTLNVSVPKIELGTRVETGSGFWTLSLGLCFGPDLIRISTRSPGGKKRIFNYILLYTIAFEQCFFQG